MLMLIQFLLSLLLLLLLLLTGEGSQSNMVFVPSKMGYLHVKNQGVGFRNWKKRWFVLKGRELICYKDGGHIENVSALL
jgi:PH domain